MSARPSRTRLRPGLAAAGAALLAGGILSTAGLSAAGGPRPGRSGGAGLSWPPGAPRVRLEALVEQRSGKAGRILRKIVGKPVESATAFARRPYGVAWDGEELIVTDPGAGRVSRMSLRGRIRNSLSGVFASPIGVAVCPNGVVVTDSQDGTVTLLAADLKPLRQLAEGFRRPTGVACGGGEVFVAETAAHRIAILGPDGGRRYLGRRGGGEGELNFPTALAFADGVLWVGDTLNFRLQRFDPVTGESLAAFGGLGDAPGEMPRVKGLAMDRRGRLWVTDAHLDQVALYTADGTFLMDLGRSGGGPGEFSFPAGVAAHPDGRVVVVDSLNRRLQVFRSLPEPGGGGRKAPK